MRTRNLAFLAITLGILISLGLTMPAWGVAGATRQDGSQANVREVPTALDNRGLLLDRSLSLVSLRGDCPDCTARLFVPLVTRLGFQVGAWIPPRWPDFDVQIGEFEAMTERHHEMYKLYMPWQNGEGDWIYFSPTMPKPQNAMQWQADAVVDNGSVPMVNWRSTHCSLDQIINGSQDAFITTWAIQVRDWDHRILINWGNEMNIPGTPWSLDPSKYRLAYRHIRNIFASVGADNAEFVWSPNYMSHPLEGWNDYNNYYPGDGYADWVGADGYCWGASASQGGYRWMTFDQIFDPILADFSVRYPDKPQMIAETACAPDDGGSKTVWITQAYQSLKGKHWPRVQAVFWFQENKEKNWLVESGPGDTLQAYIDAVDGSSYGGP